MILHINVHYCKNCFYLPFILVSSYPDGLISCRGGLRAHSGKSYLNFTNCGIIDREKPLIKVCKPSCAVTDFWIKGIDDVPLTFYDCSSAQEELPLKECGKKNAICKELDREEQKDFEKHFKSELKFDDMKELLTIWAGNPTMATTETCLKMLTDIEAISYARCNDKDDCFKNSKEEYDYCSKANDPREACKAVKSTSNFKPSKADANVKPSKTDAMVKTTLPATTSGVAGNIGAVVYANYLVFIILSNIFN